MSVSISAAGKHMASPFKICSGTTLSIFPVNGSRIQSTSNQSNPLVFFLKKTQRHYCCHVSRSLTVSNSPEPASDPRKTEVAIPPLVERQESDGRLVRTDPKLDKWMIGSVEEIVENLRKSPLLVHIYAGGKRKEVIRAEHAAEEEWEEIMKKWENGQRRSPDGLIFVGELQDEKEEKRKVAEEEGCGTKTWGIVVQGRGRRGRGGGGGGCSPSCYLLKTTTVNGGAGTGLFAAHYCLIRVSSFSETPVSQFIKAGKLGRFDLSRGFELNPMGILRCGILVYPS